VLQLLTKSSQTHKTIGAGRICTRSGDFHVERNDTIQEAIGQTLHVTVRTGGESSVFTLSPQLHPKLFPVSPQIIGNKQSEFTLQSSFAREKVCGVLYYIAALYTQQK